MQQWLGDPGPAKPGPEETLVAFTNTTSGVPVLRTDYEYRQFCRLYGKDTQSASC